MLNNVFLLLKFAFRNVIRNTRRSLLTIFMIAAGFAIVFWLQSILAGRTRNVIEKIVSTYAGNIQVYKTDYFKTRQQQYVFNDAEVIKNLDLNQIEYSSRVHQPTLVSSGEQSLPIMLDGIDPEHEARITHVEKYLVAGNYLSRTETDCKKPEIYIGKSLAENLNVTLGNKLVLLSQLNDGSLGSALFFISGFFDSGSPEFDKKVAYASIECVRNFANTTGTHELIMKLKDSHAERQILKDLQDKLSNSYAVTTWKEAMPRVASMIKFNDALLYLISMMIFAVVVLGVVNTLLINLFERTREFGIMLALGTKMKFIQIMVLVEVLILGIISGSIGFLVGLIFVLRHKATGFDLTPLLGEKSFAGELQLDMVIYPYVDIGAFLKIALLILAFLVIAGFFPILRIRKLSAVETMRG